MEDEPLPPGYPVEWEADVVLRDGTVAHVRPICPSDADGIRRFHAAQSDESIYLRFFAPLRQLSDNDVHRFTHVDYADRVALVATMREEIIGIGRYDRIDVRSAEVAFNISDHFQGKGIGSVLLEHLAAIAQEFGIARFTAEVLPQNRKMLSVFSDAGYDVKRHIEDGVVEVGFDIEPTDSSKAVAMSREHRAEALSVRSILHPSTIAVIGASRRRDSIGSQLLDRLVQAGFTGTIHPVNPNVRTLRRRTAYPSVVAVPGQVDLAVIAVPAHAVLEVVDECAEAGVKSLLVVSSGFAEEGRDGARLQAELLRRARNAGMRVVGPNSFGLINNDPAVRLNASLAPDAAAARAASGSSRSPGRSASRCSRRPRAATSASRRFGSAGNRVDVSGNDFMQYWIDDESTTAVGLYLESMGNPRKFSRVARNLALIKPVIVVKSGVSAFGVPPGHRVRKTKARPEVFEAMLKQAGVIRVENVHQLFDIAQLVAHQPLPSRRPGGHRGQLHGAGDPDRRRRHQLGADRVARAGRAAHRGDRRAVPHGARRRVRRPQGRLGADLLHPAAGHRRRGRRRRRPRHGGDGSGKPCAATFLGMRGVDDGHASVSGTGGSSHAIPVYTMPEDAVRALAAATRYGAVAGQGPRHPRRARRHQPAHRGGRRAHRALGRPEGPSAHPRRGGRPARGLRHRRVGQGGGATRPTRPSPPRSGWATPWC